MSHVSNNTYQPTCTLQAAKARAELYQQIRRFFEKRNVLEVETPILCEFGCVTPQIESIRVESFNANGKKQDFFLQTSPEYAMKRLLSAGFGDIYQLARMFRSREVGRFHNPEFAMLEWYRIGFDHFDLMNEVDDLLQATLQSKPAEKWTYAELFLKYLDCDIATVSEAELQQRLKQHDVELHNPTSLNKTDYLMLCMSHLIEPKIGFEAPAFIYDFPKEQAALARLSEKNPEVASRFEVYIQGIEIANGFHELCDHALQYQRFCDENKERLALQLPEMNIDHRFIEALQAGMPECAGVALGVDRLLMLILNADHLHQVLTFPWERA